MKTSDENYSWYDDDGSFLPELSLGSLKYKVRVITNPSPEGASNTLPMEHLRSLEPSRVQYVLAAIHWKGNPGF
jgi:hypothetical protein